MVYAVPEPNFSINNWRDWFILLHTPGVGPVTWHRLMQQFGSPSAVLRADRKQLQAAGLKNAAIDWLANPNLQPIAAGLAWLNIAGNHLIPLEHELYPPLLAKISNPPPLLFVTGNPINLCKPQIAIVGSRNPTEGGRNTAREFANILAAQGYVVTSGLAVGIDAAAHEGALDAGITIAVSATGLDRVYPASHHDLAHRIVKTGAMTSEFSPGTPVRRESFPQRNRIISGMCLGVLVVEAAADSGSLITAKSATEQGREVFAIPGSIHNPLSKGCHNLIRNGAKLVESAQDVIEELGSLTASHFITEAANPFLPSSPALSQIPLSKPTANLNIENLDSESKTLLACLGHDPVSQDALIQRSKLPAHTVSATLTDLEINGYITAVPGGRYCIANTKS